MTLRSIPTKPPAAFKLTNRTKYVYFYYRDVGRSENPGVPVVIRWAQYVPQVEIGLTDLPKSGGAMAVMALSAPPGTAPLQLNAFPRTHLTPLNFKVKVQNYKTFPGTHLKSLFLEQP